MHGARYDCIWYSIYLQVFFLAWYVELSDQDYIKFQKCLGPFLMENTHAWKCISDNLPGITHMSAFLEKCQKSICMFCCSPIQGRRSLRVSNLGYKYLPYFKKKRTFPHGLADNYASKWISDNFTGVLTYVLFLENCQKYICLHGCSLIHKERS